MQKPPPKKPQIDPFEQAVERRRRMAPKPPEAASKPKEQAPDTLEGHIEKAVINFTRIPEFLIEALLSQVLNYTPIDLEKHEEEMNMRKDQDELAAVRRRLQQLRDEEQEARDYFKEKKLNKEREEEEEEKLKLQEEEERKRAEMAQEEPGTKQARGSLSLFGAKKKKKSSPSRTIENKAGKGKN